jgi:NCAIR mutase (PurE)-related protein
LAGRHTLNTQLDLDSFANLDFAREERCGFPEVVYGAGKTPAQVASIMAALAAQHDVALCTRASAEQADAVRALVPQAYYLPSCGMVFVDRRAGSVRVAVANVEADEAASATVGSTVGTAANNTVNATTSTAADTAASKTANAAANIEVSDVLACPGGTGFVVVCCAGTSDLAIAQEAAVTARLMGSRVALLTDVGIAGVHRVLSHKDKLRHARVIVAVAGMEGALPSLVAGLVDVPVIAVPTSVGYGASFGGIAALLGMLNSCAGGVSVVNIDNGFGAGVIAHRINMPPTRFTQSTDSDVNEDADKTADKTGSAKAESAPGPADAAEVLDR